MYSVSMIVWARLSTDQDRCDHTRTAVVRPRLVGRNDARLQRLFSPNSRPASIVSSFHVSLLAQLGLQKTGTLSSRKHASAYSLLPAASPDAWCIVGKRKRSVHARYRTARSSRALCWSRCTHGCALRMPSPVPSGVI
jgi:hypothetical protein